MKLVKTKIIGLAVISALLLSVAPAIFADPPAEIPFGPIVFDDLDPCTGESHTLTIFIDTFVHLGHPNNIVDRGVRTGFTSSGYELFAGNDLFLTNAGTFRMKFKDMWRHDDGRMFRAAGVFVVNFNTGEIVVNKFAIECVGN